MKELAKYRKDSTRETTIGKGNDKENEENDEEVSARKR